VTIQHLHFVCYRWGEKYVSQDVNILQAMIARNLKCGFTFHCITDDSRGLNSEIVAHELPRFDFVGIWRKLYTFSDNFLGLEGQYVVCIDLDVVIVADMGFLLGEPQLDFMIGRNWGNDGRASGTLYRLKVGTHCFLWDDFFADPETAITRHHTKDLLTGEQGWLDHKIPEFDFFPDGNIVSFKAHCGARGLKLFSSRRLGVDWRIKLGTAKPPQGASVVSFHGHPLPRDMLSGPFKQWKSAPFVAENWHL